jgi:DNA-binding MarR family transcriptional regulator
MTTTFPPLTPQIVGQAERAHQPHLDRIVAVTGTTRNQWVTLAFIGAAGGTADRDQLAGQITGALRVDGATAAATIAELTAVHLLADLPEEGHLIGFTDAGRARYEEIRAAINEVISRVYRDIPAEDLATAGRVLTLITARLNSGADGS